MKRTESWWCSCSGWEGAKASDQQVQVHTVPDTDSVNNNMTLPLLQSAGSAKDEKDKGKKGKKGKGKDEPVRRPACQKPGQKQRTVEAAAKKPEQPAGGEAAEERVEEGGAAEQEEKVHVTSKDTLHLLCCRFIINDSLLMCIFSQDEDADQDNPGAEVESYFCRV